MEIVICRDAVEAGKLGAATIAELVRNKPDAVLGLATGSSPLAIYDELARLYEAGEVSFAKAKGFSLDEYVGLAADHPEGYDRYSPMVSRLMHLLIIDVLATCVALRIGSSLQPILQQMKENLRAKRYA